MKHEREVKRLAENLCKPKSKGAILIWRFFLPQGILADSKNLIVYQL